MQEVSSKDLARQASHWIALVRYGRERVLVTRNGRPMAMLVPLEEPHPVEAGSGAANTEEARP